MVEAAGAPVSAFMERALFLAERGRGRTTPNPMVGAVVVDDAGVVVGQGAHVRAGEAHAEVIALEAAGAEAAGATLYCTLEPCCHTGRTGPCAERVAAAGIVRVVAAMSDPNPRVAGGGFAYLRDRGIAVDIGDGAAGARQLNAPFLTWITRQRPHVTIKAAVSADGFVGRRGERIRLTGAIADRYFHRQRAEVDAMAVGADTVLADDPLLTARLAYRERPLVRVLVDWRLRIPASSRVFSTLSAGPVIMVVSRRAAESRPEHLHALRAVGADFEVLDDRDLGALLNRLARRDILSLLVEGGPALQTAFLDAGLVDRIQWVRTPHRLGTGVAAVRFQPGRDPRCARAREVRLGDDLLTECDVHGTD